MPKMIRSKRQWICASCQFEHLKWEGICRNCNASGTLEEKILIATPIKDSGTVAARRLRRRAKDSERSIAKRMTAVDGPDPAFAKIATSTGRIGQITNIRVDAISKNYVTENKNRKVPTWMVDAWVLINQRGHDFEKNVLLHIDPPNMPRDFKVSGFTKKLDTMAVITQSRHEELIRSEKALKSMIENLQDGADIEDVINAALDTINNVVTKT